MCRLSNAGGAAGPWRRRVTCAASCDRDASRARPSRDARGSPVRRDGRAETLTWRANRRPINGLANACAGYPQACQHNLCVSAAMRTSCSAGLAAWHRDANCGEAVHNAARLAQRLHHTCQSLSDQGLSVAVRRISTSLPTFSVEKCMWRSCGAVSRCAAVHGVPKMPVGATFRNDGSCCFAMAADRNVTVDHSIASLKYVGLLASARRSWVGSELPLQ